MSERAKSEELPGLIYDSKSKTTYQKGNFLGKGGFAKCYEFKNMTTGKTFAGKVVSKNMLVKPNHKTKMCQEINIHSSLSHKYIVKLHSYFEDDNNVYIILELCRKRSLMEMHKRRKTLTIPEVRYLMHQIVLACEYMHGNKVIHRDLKLGNLFINDDMEIKVGDFGLATRVSFEGERKKTICGTPNYIAPEIITKKGHSYEVDVWSLGCIMYTMLVGSPPFETNTLKNTYNKIKKCDYFLPPRMDRAAKVLIQKLLHSEPSARPDAQQILADEFFTTGYLPSRLPTSCLTMQPRFSKNISIIESSCMERKPLTENRQVHVENVQAKDVPTDAIKCGSSKREDVYKLPNMPNDFYLSDLLQMMESVVQCRPDTLYTGQPEDAQDPSAVPFVWISKWVDYTDKYGIGYQLCDNSIGVFFNDSTHLVLHADGKNFQYIERNAEGHYYNMDNFPKDMTKKITLLQYFNSYMADKLLKAGESAKPREGDVMTQVPHLRHWFRTKSAIIFHLTNGTFQANFFEDHTKIILCPIMGAVSYIDENKNFTVYTFKLIEKYGCPPVLAARLKYAATMVQKLYKDIASGKK